MTIKYMPGTVLGTGEKAINKMNKVCLHETEGKHIKKKSLQIFYINIIHTHIYIYGYTNISFW